MPRAIVGRKTVVYAWAGIRNVLYLSLEGGANVSESRGANNLPLRLPTCNAKTANTKIGKESESTPVVVYYWERPRYR
jgi:hypothetical protein